MGVTEIRLKIRHFFKKNKKIILIVFLIWGLIIFVNSILKNRKIEPIANTTFEPHVSVIDTGSSTPKSMQDPIETLIEKYVGYCNNGEFESAFNMLSEECREYEFQNDPSSFLTHVHEKMLGKKKYSIQDYSNMTISSHKVYIYEIRYTEDILATGLTNSEYLYSTEKMSFYRDSNNSVKMSVGNYIYHNDIKSIAENEYLKIDILDKLVNYSIEQYQVKFTNRSEYTIVISDGNVLNEVQLGLPNETRNPVDMNSIVLEPGKSITTKLTFTKFVDDGDESQNLKFNTIRVMEKYSGIEDVDKETIENELNNAISKFSMELSVKE